jgi:hypothetical protein
MVAPQVAMATVLLVVVLVVRAMEAPQEQAMAPEKEAMVEAALTVA